MGRILMDYNYRTRVLGNELFTKKGLKIGLVSLPFYNYCPDNFDLLFNNNPS